MTLYDPLPYLKSSSSYKLWINRWNNELKKANYNSEDGTCDKRRPPDKVLLLCTGFANIASCPITISITIFLLWQYLGPSCLGGVGVILVMMPVSGFLALKNRQLQERQMKLKDKRLKSMTEIMSSIKILALHAFAWEPPFTGRIEAVRNGAMSLLKKYASFTASIGFF
ncbi:canalicular multispecific organic anion transporter 1-like [Tropilaelaps mercedesae]|uniref:Canalicular multispecific organic anion transporter 1-like n=1 Tax=Tropilaelaps mercedesae TaxID=418985 RepID=A0A1V9XD41_9ACAR|nr:canalicular multispecific organic anion transporter 1-like [Tropilaelaps mercedesae]